MALLPLAPCLHPALLFAAPGHDCCPSLWLWLWLWLWLVAVDMAALAAVAVAMGGCLPGVLLLY